MKTKYIKVTVSYKNLTKNTWYLRDCEDGRYDMFYCTKIEDKYVEGFGIVSNELDDDLIFDINYFFTDFFIFKEVPDHEAELVEMLIKAERELNPSTLSGSGEELAKEIRGFIQKLKSDE